MNIDNLMQLLPQHPLLQSLSIMGILCIVSFISYGITVKVIIKILTKMFRKTSTKIDDILIKRNIFNRLAYIVPVLIFYNFAYTMPSITGLIKQCALTLIVLTGLLVLNALLGAIEDIYKQTKYSNRINIKSYLQVAKLIINIFGLIIMVSILIGKNPAWLLSGIGAFAAVLIIIFKDTILSLVASFQINSNDLFKIGDWIEAPQFGADGDVKDIALHTVKIQNWDKTISIIPTHKLIDSTFKNWRGMSESGGRRIKRSIFIDINSIALCNPDALAKFKKFHLIEKYIDQKKTEVIEYNKINNIDTSEVINGRQLTNIGTFRAYIEEYLKHHENIHENMTFLVRQLEPTEKGLPIEIYVFSNDINWVNYEGIQSDIFDHLLAIIPEFGLKVFQNPTGNDFSRLG